MIEFLDDVLTQFEAMIAHSNFFFLLKNEFGRFKEVVCTSRNMW